MSKIIVVYYSGFGHTKKIAERIAKGAGGEAISVEHMNWEKLEDADAIIFGSPTYMGNVAAPFKKFMDDSSKIWLGQKWKNKIAGGFTNSSSPSGDMLNTLQTIMIFAMQHSMIYVGTGLAKDNNGINRIGSYSGTMAQSENAPPEVTPPESDLMTAELYGKRIAEITARFKK